jgi:condensin complex subunit 3
MMHPQMIFKYENDFWEALTIETAFLMQVYYKYLAEMKDPLLEDVLPELSTHAKRIETYFINSQVEESEEQKTADEFILTQLLEMSKYLDFGDELGRRKMLALLGTLYI